MVELKPATSYSEQRGLLRERGFIIEDEDECEKMLARIGYYRLTGYLLPFKRPDDTYQPGTSFSRVCSLYEFDRGIRAVIFSAIEEVEINLRAKFAYYHGHKYGADGYLHKENYIELHEHDKFKAHLDQEKIRNARVPVIKHHNEKYNGDLPIWVAMEFFSFGMLSRFYADLKNEDQEALRDIVVAVPPVKIKALGSWLRCCTDLRNICAHYGRLYDRTFTSSPTKGNLKGVTVANRWRLFAALMVLRNLYPDPDKWNNQIFRTIEALEYQYREEIEYNCIGFPNDWDILLSR